MILGTLWTAGLWASEARCRYQWIFLSVVTFASGSFRLMRLWGGEHENSCFSITVRQLGLWGGEVELSDDRKFVINLLGKDLRKGSNKFKVIVDYEDRNGKSYGISESFVVELANVTLIQDVFLAWNGLLDNLNNLTMQNLILLIVSILVVFILVVWVIFRERK